MSIQFDEFPPHLEQNQESSSSTSDNVDVLDEFLDRRLYDDAYVKNQQQQQGQQQPGQQQGQQVPEVYQREAADQHMVHNDDLFQEFLVDDMASSGGDFIFSAVDAQGHDMNSFDLGDAATSTTLLPFVEPSSAVSNGNGNGNKEQAHMFSKDITAASPTNLTATTPVSIDMSPPGSTTSNNEVFTTPTSLPNETGGSMAEHSVSTQNESHRQQQQQTVSSSISSPYEAARNILSGLKFGREVPPQFDNEFPKHYLGVNEETLPYRLTLENLPSCSRVETQIKLELKISPPPQQFLVHLPSDTIAKQKLCLSSELDQDAKDQMLFLDTYVLTSDDKPCNICTKCIRREQKRASRRKSGVSDNMSWMTNTHKRAIIFNCKEVISFPATPINGSSSVGLSSRIVCYCRHHNEPTGFKLLLLLRDSKGNLVAKHLSSPIMIMDRKKSGDDGSSNAQLSNTASNSANEGSSILLPRSGTQHPISPTSIEDDSSEAIASSDYNRATKRKKTWSPELSDGFSIAPSRTHSTAIKRESITHTSRSSLDMSAQHQPVQPLQPVLPYTLSTQSLQQQLQQQQQQQQQQQNVPIIQKVIPAQGPLRGGIEVTLLGQNFKDGLVVKFGPNKALATQWWSATTMVTYLPPAPQAGQVIVTVEDLQTNQKTGSTVFTYVDDTDRQMIELALQIVGLKMNGKLEDARNIARKIIGSDGSGNNNGDESGTSSQQDTPMTGYSLQYDSDEDLILKVINMLPNRPNWSLCTAEGQTLLHLSSLKSYNRLVSCLLQKGARVDSKDVMGYTPLHYAALAGNRVSIEMLLNCKAKIDAKTDNGLTPEDVADANVLDLFKYHNSLISRKFSSTSISSSIFSIDDDQIDIQGGSHVSRMTTDGLTDDDYESDYDEDSDESSADASNEESENDFADNEGDSVENLPAGSSNEVTGTGSSQNGSLWNKVRNVFQNAGDADDLPRYDDLFPIGGQFSLTKLRFSSTTTAPATISNEATEDNGSSAQETSSDESEDVFMKFFNQRKNVQNDKMLLFFWLPLLFVIMSTFILHSTGYTTGLTTQFQDFMRDSVSKIMLGNERVKVALNKHFSQGYHAVTSAINA